MIYKKLKQTLTFTLSLLLLFSFAACGGNTQQPAVSTPGSNGDISAASTDSNSTTTPAQNNSPAQDNSNNTKPAATQQNPSTQESSKNTTLSDTATTTEQTPATQDGEILSSGNFFDWVKAGSYYYETKTTSSTDDDYTHYTYAKDGEDYASIVEDYEADGTLIRKIHSIKKGAQIVVINENEKTYMELPPEFADATKGIQDAFSDMKKVNEGTGEIDGKTLPYEEYDTSGIHTKYFFENGQLYGYIGEVEFGDTKIVTVSIITKQSKKPPADLFEVPAGYQEIKV